MRRVILILLCVLSLAAAWFFWPRVAVVSPLKKSAAAAPVASAAAGKVSPAVSASHPAAKAKPFAFRLANTSKSIGELASRPHAILLENALLDTSVKMDLQIPAHLKSAGEPGAYIVQARGLINANFRALIARAGGQVVSYIPNNAYLVRLTSGAAAFLADNVLVQAVLPYEPYYKVSPSLLGRAVEQQPLAPGVVLTLGLFAADAGATEKQVASLGATIVGTDASPFGPVLRVMPPADWTALARLPGVQVLEQAHRKVAANDLSRVTLGVTTDTTSGITNDWLGLTGANVLVQVNDSGIDATHPDLTGRIFGLTPTDLADTNGHGTFVAGQIAGNGSESSTLDADEPQGSVTNADFRGKAPLADLFSINYNYSDQVLQEAAAVTNALISNNSWNYGGDADYDLAAASYDAATRDALPGTTGSQPVLFVFSAGNSGGGNDDGEGGNADTILSPGTAKNVITVGALEQLRNITNIVTTISDGTTNQSEYWLPQTDSSSQVAGYSSRGNVGVGTEGTYGRFKPDVVAPGNFVVSTRSGQWDTNAYFSPTNVQSTAYTGQEVGTNALVYYSVSVPANATAVVIAMTTNKFSTVFPADMPIYVKQSSYPSVPGGYDYVQNKDGFDIPPDAPIATYTNGGFYFGVGNSTNVPVNYDLTVTIYTTNSVGDSETVLEGMDDQLAPWYRYESGTSMSAADVSGVLALMQDYFTNTLGQTPSPALLKAMLINGARSAGSYELALTNGVNFQGWGLPDIENSLPLTTSNLTSIGTNSPFFFVDQNPATALATGDSHTYILNVNTNSGSLAQELYLQATLVWTDPCGDPSAAIKLVNNLELVVTNLDTGDVNYGSVYYGNDISADTGCNLPWDTNSAPNIDTINNVQNVILPPLLAGSYSITVVGRAVNVNAVTAQTNNVVQDYALVVSIGEGEEPQAISSMNDLGIVSNPTGGQDITVVTTTNSPLFNQFAGANTPLLGTNGLPIGTNTIWGADGQLTVGMTNQWHFYVVTNTGPTADYTNAAFITFDAYDLSVPRTGVYADSVADATRPEADIDLYVSTDPSITNLNPVAISNCLAGTVINTANSYGASVSQGGTEFVFFTNSSPNQTYYVGVKSEDQMASEYAFLPVFTSTPFSSLDQNGNEVVNGLLLPTLVPDGSPAHPGVTNAFALAVIPMDVEKVTVNSLNEHQNFGDLVGTLTFGGTSVVLNNHDGLGNTFGGTPISYDDSRNPVAGTQHTDGPGTLTDYRTKSALGPWILTEVDNALTQTGQVSQFSLTIQPHRKLLGGTIVTVPAQGWFIDYVDVTPGYTNLTFAATNLGNAGEPPFPPVPNQMQMYEKFGDEPTLTDYDLEADLTNCIFGTYPAGIDPGNTLSVGPPLNPGQYYIGLYNPSLIPMTNVFISATLGLGATVNNTFIYANNTPTTLLDDAVTTSTQFIGATNLISSVNVGLVVDASRISDMTFTLVSPTGQRVLLMENRGGTSTNGAGQEFVYTNVLNSTATGGAAANTNYLAVSPAGGTIPITYNFYTVPDEMTVYAGTNPATFYLGSPEFLWDTGLTNNAPAGGGAQNTIPVTINVPYPAGITNIAIIMNQFGNPDASGGDAWTYTAGAAITNFQYLDFTDDTNLATDPIKFGIPPYAFTDESTNYTLSDFEMATNGDYFGPTNIYDAFGGWTVPTNIVTVSQVLNTTNQQFVTLTNITVLSNNLVSVVSDPADSLGDNAGSNFLALANGTITRSIATAPGRIYNITFWYRGPGISSWWRGEGNASDSSDPENNANNGVLVGRFNFPAGEVGQAFQFPDQGNEFQFGGTNTYVQIPQNPSLDVGKGGGFTVEGWINPTNQALPQPLVEWLAAVPTNSAVTNLVIKAGPYLNPATGHFYYLLGATNWATSELWAEALGGHLVTVDTANEQNWVFDNFANYGGTNRNLWIGLTNTFNTAFTFGWSSGLTNLNYTNWAAGQPTNFDNLHNYTFMFGETNLQAGLWTAADNNGVIEGSTVTNKVYGVVEVNSLQTNGVQFWISATNTPDTTNVAFAGSNGCLYANIVDTNFVSHEIYSAPGLVQSNVYQHVALTFDTNSGLAKLFLDGTNVATTNLFLGTNAALTPFVPKTDGDVLLGRDMNYSTNASLWTNNFYAGEMDEMSVYKRALSDAEINAIYRVSATATNGLTGKFDPSVVPATGLAEAAVNFGGVSNTIYAVNNEWQVDSYTFTATSNSMPLQITGLEPGILLDSFAVSEAPLTNLYYLPEQTLSSLVGDSAYGNWQLQVWDNRVGAYVTNASQLVSWQLSFVLESNATVSASLPPQTPSGSTVGAGQTVYYSVTVPSWANFATNILVSSTLPVNLLYFSPTNIPTGGNAADATLLTGQTSGVGSPVLATSGTPPVQLQPGSTYYLGVQNNGAHAASVVLEVDYDITALTNGVPYAATLATNDTVRYFSYTVSSNAYEAAFQLLKLSSNADLVISKGVPLPALTSSAYGSFNASNLDENIFVLTNSSPVPLAAGIWYLGVFKRDSGPVNYSVLAKELDLNGGLPAYNVIPLTNGVPVNYTAGPGAALTNFFLFRVTNSVLNGVTNQGMRFELYNQTGNGDLTVQTNAPPLAPPFFQTSQNSGTSAELIYVRTNSALTNLVADWYLGVPNNEVTNISFTIVATFETNAYFPAFPGATGSGGGAAGGRFGDVYHVISVADSGPGTLRDAVNTATTNRTVVFDRSGTIKLLSPLVITNSYLTIAGQTAPGGGITVAGNLTALTNAHDVVIRDVRFRPGTADDSLQFMAVSNVIADHVSASWSLNNLVSVLDSSNVTVQWSVLADSLYDTNNPASRGFGSLLRFGSGALSFNHNLYADNYNGNPRLGDNLSLDFVNNVIYGWGTNAGFSANDILDDPLGFTNQLNYACNYLIAGSNSALPSIAFWGGSTNSWIFQTNDVIDTNVNGIVDGANTQWAMFTNQFTKFGQPFSLIPVPTDEAFLAYEKILDFAGVNMGKRDPVDTNIVIKVRTQTGVLINAAGALPVLNSTLPYLDSDQDGIPDFWEWTFTTNLVYVPSNNNDRDGDGYTDLEEYNNWLAGPHALTITNTPVGVDLIRLCGKTGNLSFFVTNGVQGYVYLTNVFTNIIGSVTNVLGSPTNTGPFSNSIAVFTPTNNLPFTTNYSGYASFDVYVTNNDTVASFGPVTVSVVVSAVPVAYASFPQTNFIPAGATQWYLINVPTNADFATNALLFAAPQPLNVWFSTNAPPTVTNSGDVLLLTNSLGGTNVLGTAGSPVNTTTAFIIPGGTYYLGVQNTNAVGDNYAINVTFHLLTSPPPFAATLPGTLLTGSGAQLNGMATPNGTPATAWFEWGPSISYGLATLPIPVGSNYNVVYVTNQISGLTTNLPYHFRLVVSNAVGVVRGFDQIFDQANLLAWGADFQGQTTPIPPGLTNLVVGIGAGYNFSFALNNNGTVVAWGDDTFGQTNVPVNLTNAVSVSGGYKDGLALRSDGTVTVWGSKQFGQTNVPADLTNAVIAVSGDWHCLALRADGTLVGWGNSSFGQTNIPSNLTNVVSIATGGYHSLALNNDGTVTAWGDNTYGQTDVPAGLSGVVAVAGGEDHSLALKSDGTVVAWGDNSLGQTNVPPTVTNVIAIAAGGFHSLALRADGTVVQWGDSSAGQLTGYPTNLSNVVAVAGAGGGGFHSLALTSLFGLNQTNNAPFWTNNLNGTNITINALTTLVITNTATDTNVPAQTLTYQLLNKPAWASINFFTGVITLSPLATNAPGTNVITTVVTDSGYPPLSATNSFAVIVLPPISLTNGVPQTNTVVAGGINYYLVNVPTNADFATNRLLSATPVGLNVWFTTNPPPLAFVPGDVLLITNSTAYNAVINTNLPPLLVPGSFYWLGVQNTNNVPVTYGLQVDFHFTAATTNPPATITISSIVYTTNSTGKFGFLLTWFAPSNDLFQVQFTTNLAPADWIKFTNPPVVSYNTNIVPVNPTNAQFNFFDDGSQAPFGPSRFYRLLLLQATNTLSFLATPSNQVVSVGSSIATVTNTAIDSNPSAVLTYSLINPPVGAAINPTNGIITWTNAAPSGLAARFNTLVTDSGSPAASATNTFTVFVMPFPAITNITATATNLILSWTAPTNDQFNVQWTTNLAPPNWMLFSNGISPLVITSTNGVFSFTDTNAPLLMKFYQLILLP